MQFAPHETLKQKTLVTGEVPMTKNSTESGTETAVFVDTSLHTHLVTTVSPCDTVSDLKKKLLRQHLLCFPNIGEIQIHALKMRRGYLLYHLPESIPVKTAFAGFNDGWYVSVDASEVEKDEDNQQLVEGANCTQLGKAKVERLLNVGDESNEPMKKGVAVAQEFGTDVHGNDHSKVASLVGDVLLDVSVREKDDQFHKENEDREMETAGREGSFVKENGDGHGNESLGGVVETATTGKRKRKSKRKSRDDVDETNDSVRESHIVEAVTEIAVPENSPGNTDGVSLHDQQNGDNNDKSQSNVFCMEESNKTPAGTAQSEPARKKRRKIETEKGGGYLQRESRTLSPDANKEISGPLVIPENAVSHIEVAATANATLGGLSAKGDDDANLQLTFPNSDKKKNNKKSSKHLNQDAAVTASHGTDIQVDTSAVASGIDTKILGEDPVAESVPRLQVGNEIISNRSQDSEKKNHSRPVEEVNNKTSSQDGGKMVSEHEPAKLRAVSGAKKTRRSKNQSQVQESDNTKDSTGVSQCENIILGDHQIPSAVQNSTVEEQGEPLQTVSPATSHLETSKPSPQDKSDMKTKEVIVNYGMVDASRTEDTEKSSKKRRKSKRSRDLATGDQNSSVPEQVDGSANEISAVEPNEAVKDQPSSDKVNAEGSNMPPDGMKQAPDMDTMSTSLLAAGEINDVIHNVVESVQNMGEANVTTENRDRKSRKKTKKKCSTGVKNVAGSEADEGINLKAVESSMDSKRGLNTSNEITKQTNVEKTSFLNRLDEACSRHEEDNTKEVLNSAAVDSSHVPRELEDAVNKTPTKSSQVEVHNSIMETPLEGNGINFNDYFVPQQENHQEEVVATSEMLVDKTARAKEGNSDMKANKNKKKPSKVPGSEVKASPPKKWDKLDGISEEARPSSAVKASGAIPHAKEKREASTVSNSNLGSPRDSILQTKRANLNKSSVKPTQVSHNKKGPFANTGKGANSARPKKSIIGTSGAIFKEYSAGTFSDVASDYSDSDASTRNPSDNSSASDYSDGESNADFNPSQGSYSSKRKEASKRSAKALSSASGVSLDTILRGSTRYKKAKLTASQSQLEDDIDIVPESQPVA